MKLPPLRYTVEIADAAAHLFRVSLSVPQPDLAGVSLSLPAWLPGSYMIREFAKNIVTLRATQGTRKVVLTKQDKHTWSTGKLTGDAPLEVVAEIYAWDLSVRCAHLDQTHGFFNGTQMFLSVAGREHLPHEVELRRPAGEGFAAWRVATTLTAARGTAKLGGFGVYTAADYDELVDHPVEMGTFKLLKFSAGGVPHQVAVTGRTRFDEKRLCADLKKICEWQIEFFGGKAPFKNYLFLVMAVGDGYGGLEHRSSTALLCSRNDLPVPGTTSIDERYRGFLGLCSHEYFHSWNVKRIKPARFLPYTLSEEGYTSLLWVFEGFTSYYDDIALVRSGLISQADYLGMLAKTIAGVERHSGRHKQSVAESSFDAWIKYYRQDENSPNAIVSYYTKGSLVAAGLDLTIRAATQGKRSLDNVMLHLWTDYALQGRGVGEGEMAAIIKQATGVDVSREIVAWVEGISDVPFEKLLKPYGIALERKRGNLLSGLGIKTRAEGSALKLANVLDGGSAQRAGLSAGDELVALDGLRVTAGNLDNLLLRYDKGQVFELSYFRRDELTTASVRFEPPRMDECALVRSPGATAAVTKLRNDWLGREASA
ncbi:PDZ domain-containing protein [Uliginosibacterium sp. H3]|uniref:PDZ domain-containing protein n=1 Tax=Uliginosibacterium silvisoli TaxID=3114758 RepID=A0ABU6K4E1_9RHOO|nr:PDZ domain-containing protein [Uliginosibacterium sp. H3]